MKPYNKFITIIFCCIIGLLALFNIIIINNIEIVRHHSLFTYICSFGSIFCFCACTLYASKNKPVNRKGFVLAFVLPVVVFAFCTAATYIAIFSVFH